MCESTQGLVSGACCVTAFIEGQDVVVSNLGDCRAVLCRGGVAETLTTDHKAEREDEQRRIENKVVILCGQSYKELKLMLIVSIDTCCREDM